MSEPTPRGENTIRIKIKRQDTPQTPAYWQEFDVPYKPDSNVISCLQSIAAQPTTVDGQSATPVTWDSNCLEEVCGACTMVINGKVRQSCSALVRNLIRETDDNTITLEPMAKFPIVRDLMVDRSRMFDNLKDIKGWVPIDGTHHLGAGPTETPEQQDLRYALSRCMTCGCCLEACPEFSLENDFVGAQIFAQVHYFNLHETGKILKDDRLQEMEKPGGITDCGNAQNCVKVCPKELPLTTSIPAVGRQTTVHSLKKFFSGKK